MKSKQTFIYEYVLYIYCTFMYTYINHTKKPQLYEIIKLKCLMRH
jgi:hypothetical protein